MNPLIQSSMSGGRRYKPQQDPGGDAWLVMLALGLALGTLGALALVM